MIEGNIKIEKPYFHAPIHLENEPKIDEDDNKAVTKFIEKYISCLLPNTDQYPKLNAVVEVVQNNTERKVARRFNAPWPPSAKTHCM